jgi:hypothetical protein
MPCSADNASVFVRSGRPGCPRRCWSTGEGIAGCGDHSDRPAAGPGTAPPSSRTASLYGRPHRNSPGSCRRAIPGCHLVPFAGGYAAAKSANTMKNSAMSPWRASPPPDSRSPTVGSRTARAIAPPKSADFQPNPTSICSLATTRSPVRHRTGHPSPRSGICGSTSQTFGFSPHMGADVRLDPAVPANTYHDSFGNFCHVIRVPSGRPGMNVSRRPYSPPPN